MKATIEATGELKIKAETDLEHYALSKWWDDWQEHKVGFQIEIIARDRPSGTTKFKTVYNRDPIHKIIDEMFPNE